MDPAPAAVLSISTSVDELQRTLAARQYIAGRDLAVSIFLSLRLKRPLFLEGEPGVGKTEVAKVLAPALDAELIRLQCYEGLDIGHAVYEWNYPRQILEIRLLEREKVTTSPAAMSATAPASAASSAGRRRTQARARAARIPIAR